MAASPKPRAEPLGERTRVSNPEKETLMADEQHAKGHAEHAKGSVKEAAGKVTGDKDLEAEGKADKTEGSLRKAAGDVKDAFKGD